MNTNHTPTQRYSNSVEFELDPTGFALSHGFTPPPSFDRRDEWTQRQMCGRFLEDAGVDVHCSLTPARVALAKS